MSTILDALRKLQREREGDEAERDIRRAVTHPSRKRRRSRGVLRPFVALVVLLAGAVAGAWYVIPEESAALVARYLPVDRWLGLATTPVEPERAPVTTARRSAPPPTARVPEPEPVPEPDPVPEALIAEPPPELPTEVPSQAPAGTPTDVAALTDPPAPPPTPKPRAQDPEEANVVAARAAQSPPPAPLAPVAPSVPAPAPEQAVASAPTPDAATTDAEEERAKRELARLLEEKARKRAAALDDDAYQPRPRKAASKPGKSTATPDAEEIPEIHLRSVRWHPLAGRRVVSLDLPQMGPLELREGDIAAGVLVRRIDPGSIEVQVGSARRRIALEP